MLKAVLEPEEVMLVESSPDGERRESSSHSFSTTKSRSETFKQFFGFFQIFVFNICISLGNWGVKGAICKILEILDQN